MAGVLGRKVRMNTGRVVPGGVSAAEQEGVTFIIS